MNVKVQLTLNDICIFVTYVFSDATYDPIHIMLFSQMDLLILAQQCQTTFWSFYNNMNTYHKNLYVKLVLLWTGQVKTLSTFEAIDVAKKPLRFLILRLKTLNFLQ